MYERVANHLGIPGIARIMQEFFTAEKNLELCGNFIKTENLDTL